MLLGHSSFICRRLTVLLFFVDPLTIPCEATGSLEKSLPHFFLCYLRNYLIFVSQSPLLKNRGASVLSRFSHVQLCVTPWSIAHPAPLSMEFSRHEYWSVLPFPSPGIFLNQGSNLSLLHHLHWQVGSLPVAQTGKIGWG